jgi:uncharacterized membrane protein
MTLEPLLNASPAVQFHVLTVVPAALIGTAMLLAKKGTYIHRMGGRVWIALMMLTALSTFFIHEINMFHGFSPIHLLSLVVLVSAVEVVRSARQRNFARHKRLVKSLYFGGIGIAGLFTLLPGRIMHDVVFTSAVARPVQSVAPVTAHASTGAPIWVWPLLVAVIALGVSRMRDRDLPLWRLILLPLVLSCVSLLSTISGHLNASVLAAVMAGALAGLFAGLWSMRAVPVGLLSGNRVRVKGEVVSLFAILGIFATHFAAGTLAATAPDMLKMQGVAELFALLPVFCSSLMSARALAQAGYNPLGSTREQLIGQAEY